MFNVFVKTALWLVSVGWIAPLGFAAFFFWEWLDLEVAPVVYGGERAVNSFPFLAESQRLFWIGFAWAALVVASWAAYLIGCSFRTARELS
jgi:hypothetical protein